MNKSETKREKYDKFWKSIPHRLTSEPIIIKTQIIPEKVKLPSIIFDPKFLPFFKIFSYNLDYFKIEIKDNYLYIKAMDNSHVAFLDLKISLDELTTNNLPKSFFFCVESYELYKFLSKNRKERKEILIIPKEVSPVFRAHSVTWMI